MRNGWCCAFAVTVVLLGAACYPGQQPSRGAVSGALGGEVCSGLKQGEWTWPRSSDHCWAVKAREGKQLRLRLRTRSDEFDAVVALYQRLDGDHATLIDRARVQGSGTTKALDIEVPKAHGNIFIVRVSDVSGGSYMVNRN